MSTENTNDYEKRVLAQLPGKVLTFLRAAATKVEIRAQAAHPHLPFFMAL